MPSQTSQQIVDQLVTEYEASVKRLQLALSRYLSDGTAPTIEERNNCDYCYPELAIKYFGKERDAVSNLAFGKLEKVGTYRTTLTKPDLFADYLREQLDLLTEQYEVEISVGRSNLDSSREHRSAI